MKITLMIAPLVTAALVLSALTAAIAGDDHHGHGARHGGQFKEVEDHHGIEMVAGDTVLVFHLTEDHKPMDLTDGSFKAIVQTDSGTKMLPLAVDGNTLKTAIDSPLPDGARIALSGKDRHGHAIQARFVKE